MGGEVFLLELEQYPTFWGYRPPLTHYFVFEKLDWSPLKNLLGNSDIRDSMQFHILFRTVKTIDLYLTCIEIYFKNIHCHFILK
jgi:hypothetical protein